MLFPRVQSTHFVLQYTVPHALQCEPDLGTQAGGEIGETRGVYTATC